MYSEQWKWQDQGWVKYIHVLAFDSFQAPYLSFVEISKDATSFPKVGYVEFFFTVTINLHHDIKEMAKDE